MRKHLLLSVGPVALLWLVLALTVQATAKAGTVTQEGWFTVIWGDSWPGSNLTTAAYFLTDEKGQVTQLYVSEQLIQAAGGIVALNRQHVIITGEPLRVSRDASSTRLQVNSIQLDAGHSSVWTTGNAPIIGSHPWVSLLCKFSDVVTETHSLAYFYGMYRNTYPGLDHYWREQSYDLINVMGSSAAGWFTLPRPKSYYVYDANGDGISDWDFKRATRDCTAVADATVNFANVDGINLMFNEALTYEDYSIAYGGSWYMTLDGVARSWRMTWEPYDMSFAVLYHEMGHGFGWSHSSTGPTQSYNNPWDVMSNPFSHWDPAFGTVGQHTIAAHKDFIGWIPDGRIYTARAGRATISLERLALPQTGNFLMAKIPIDGTSTRYYTLEARQWAGYDSFLPGEAVIIHEVTTTLSTQAYLVLGGSGSSTERSMWTPGEMFKNTSKNISVCIEAKTSTGFVVTIGAGVSIGCNAAPDFSTTTIQPDPVRPIGGQRVKFTTRLINTGFNAYEVVVTSTIPNHMTFVPGSATISNGGISSTIPLVFNVAFGSELAYNTPVMLTFDATVDAGLLTPIALQGPMTIAWDGGSLTLPQTVVVNGLATYLPLARK